MSDTMGNKINKSDWPVMEFGRRKAEAMLILFRVREHSEKPAKVFPALVLSLWESTVDLETKPAVGHVL